MVSCDTETIKSTAFGWDLEWQVTHWCGQNDLVSSPGTVISNFPVPKKLFCLIFLSINKKGAIWAILHILIVDEMSTWNAIFFDLISWPDMTNDMGWHDNLISHRVSWYLIWPDMIWRVTIFDLERYVMRCHDANYVIWKQTLDHRETLEATHQP